jgi:rhomboid family GlyGly-CTERM serine protease
MTYTVSLKLNPADSSIRASENKPFTFLSLTLDVWAFVCIIFAANTHIFFGEVNTGLIFLPQAVRAGEWTRIFTHPFLHLSWYHLILDAGAFFLLYTGLEEQRISMKLLYVILCGAFSLLFALWFSPMIQILGLCGLSGVAHGLMAISGLEMIRTPENRTAGLVSLGMVLAKGVYELITGKALLAFLLLGMCGEPVAACHTGGIAGGIIAFFCGIISTRAAKTF